MGRSGDAEARRRGEPRRPPRRGPVAAAIGVVGALLYVVLAVTLADLVIGVHWSLDLLYFAAAGLLWTVPAARLMRWALAPEA
ncbi:MAG: DUF2842 domain-containing protein, partial [Acetobacteraceae bacterium]